MKKKNKTRNFYYSDELPLAFFEIAKWLQNAKIRVNIAHMAGPLKVKVAQIDGWRSSSFYKLSTFAKLFGGIRDISVILQQSNPYLCAREEGFNSGIMSAPHITRIILGSPFYKEIGRKLPKRITMNSVWGVNISEECYKQFMQVCRWNTVARDCICSFNYEKQNKFIILQKEIFEAINSPDLADFSDKFRQLGLQDPLEKVFYNKEGGTKVKSCLFKKEAVYKMTILALSLPNSKIIF